jgi:predicted transcriptional regulator
MSNPSVSFRIPLEVRERLDELKAKTGQSLGELLRQSLGVTERNVQSAHDTGWDEGRAIGIEQGKKWGYAEAKQEWLIYYYCNICKDKIEIRPNTPVHQAIVDALYERNWGHSRCHGANQ